jgi:hypothetical protein
VINFRIATPAFLVIFVVASEVPRGVASEVASGEVSEVASVAVMLLAALSAHSTKMFTPTILDLISRWVVV